jgi:hypothetical protein
MAKYSNVVKQTLKNQMDDLQTSYLTHFKNEVNKAGGTEFVMLTPNGVKVTFTIDKTNGIHNVEYAIKNGITCTATIEGLDEYHNFKVRYDARTFESVVIGRYGNTEIISSPVFKIDIEETLVSLTKEMEKIYWFKTDKKFIQTFVETELNQKIKLLFPKYSKYMEEYLEIENQYSNYDSMLLDTWKKDVLKTGMLETQKSYDWQCRENSDGISDRMRIYSSSFNLWDIHCAIYEGGTYKKRSVYMSDINYILEYKKGKYVAGFVKDFTLPIELNDYNNNFKKDYYFTSAGVDKFLDEVYKKNNWAVENNSFESVVQSINDGGEVEINIDNIQPDVWYGLLPNPNGYAEFITAELLELKK